MTNRIAILRNILAFHESEIERHQKIKKNLEEAIQNMAKQVKTPEMEMQIGESSPLNKLTKTEKEIFWMIGDGLSIADIAKKRGTNYKTVQKHRENICRKLGVKGSHKLMAYAIKLKHEQGPGEENGNNAGTE